MKSILFLVLFIPNLVWAQNLQLINWFAGADLVGETNSESELNSDFTVREFEFAAYSQIDQTWEGQLTWVIHNEPTSTEEPHIEVHEAYLFSSRLIDGSTLKIGRYLIGVGRLNRFHRHDWAITYAPLYHEEFFGVEAVIDDGVEYTKLLSESFYLNLTAGITTGNRFKDSHAHGEHEASEEEEFENAKVPTHYARLSSFVDINTQKGIEYGLNYIGRTDAEKNKFHYLGLDFIFKDKISRYNNHLLQFEAWRRTTLEKEENEEFDDYGAYLYYEKGMDRHHAIGLRVDWYKPHIHEEETEQDHGTEIEDAYTEVGLTYNYTNSEFMKTRLTIATSQGLVIAEEEVTNHKLTLQTVFTIGAHPAHLF